MAQKKQQDQPLRGANDMPFIGKIADPVAPKPAMKRTAAKSKKETAAQPKETPVQQKKETKPAKSTKKTKSTGTKKTQTSRKGRGRKPEAEKPKPSVRAYFLGGLNEIGKNFTLFEFGQDMIIVDCGLAFPDEDMPGIDAVIPDFSFVEKNSDRILGIFITHGHEDHIGALPYLLKKINVPVYGTALTLALIENKLKEHNMGWVQLNVTPAGSHVLLGDFDVELIHVNHSISDAVALAIHTPAGV
ncbi:MAG: ribonuclease J, partial [Clostridia bacterium]|nr:ribonuclease J [Clostridia bacterium]